MRKKKAMLNSIASMSGEIVSIICGLILPRLILSAFGSSYNGITASISQFLSCVVLLRAGIGGVTRAALYKPLADNDNEKISGIVNATAVFMRKVAGIYLCSLIGFAVIYPFAVKDNFNWLFSMTLVLIIGSSTFIDNYFGIANHMLLMADQRNYINTILQIGTTILNTLIAAILIKCGASIHLVKLGSALVYFIRPLFLYFYVWKNYKIDKKVSADNVAISQRWDAFAQQAAAFVNNNTDIMVLTLFTDIKEVSVYTVYYMVTNGLYKVEQTLTDSMEAAFGNMIAKNETDTLKNNFRIFEFMVFSVSSFLFICGGLLIVPFVSVYTKGINDISYARPLFGALMCINQFLFCVRLPYHMLSDAAGHFRQTRNGAIFEAFMNIIVSVILVIRFGLIGVTIGTLCAMTFRTLQYSIYSSKNILHRSMNVVIKMLVISILEAITCVFITNLIPIGDLNSYFKWVLYAVCVATITLIIILVYSFIFFRDEEKMFAEKILSVLKIK